jgi:arylsulfatase A-like enzyme
VAGSDDQGARSGQPNVVFILVDNVGWGDIGCYGGLAPTPRIDGLAGQGVRFKNYNVEAQCAPTRSAVLSGRLPIRTGNCSVPLPGQGDYGLAPWEYTLGELFSDAGYATAAFGKWHVGDIEGRLPTDQGFDEWYGIKNTSDESAYSTYPLFAESGFPVPKIWEGTKARRSARWPTPTWRPGRAWTSRSRRGPSPSSSGTPTPARRSSPT